MKITITATEYIPPRCRESVTYNYQMDLSQFRALSGATIGPAKEIDEALTMVAKLVANLQTLQLAQAKGKSTITNLLVSLDAKLRDALKPRLDPLREIIGRVVEKAEGEVRVKMEARQL